jgi:predicted CoA-binding protein
MNNDDEKIQTFLSSGPYAVVGASTDRNKYGNKVLRAYLQHGLKVYPVHPKAREVENQPCYPSLRELPEPVRAASVITPPPMTERVVEDAHAAGLEFVWMQPGAESPAAVARGEELGMTVIAGGPCVLVKLGFKDE